MPLLIGVALSFAIPHLKPLVKLEHSLFFTPNLKESALEREPLEDFKISAFPLILSEPRLQRTFISDDKPAVTDWMLAIHTLRGNEAESLTISPLLSWPDSNELELRALEHEISEFPNTVLGYDLRLASIPQTFPDYLKGSQLKKITGDQSSIPKVNAISILPSVTSGLHGFRLMENAQPQFQTDSIEIPLLARWGDHILPSIELASIIARHDLSPSEVHVHLGSHIRLSNDGLIIQIDSSGRAQVKRVETPSNTEPLGVLASADHQKSPKQVIILGTDDAPHLQRLPQSLIELSSPNHGEPTTYQRVPHWIEIPLLILFVLLFSWKGPLSILWLPIPILIATFSQQWLLWTPALAIPLTYLLLRMLLKKAKPEEEPKRQAATKKSTKKKSKQKRSRKKKR